MTKKTCDFCNKIFWVHPYRQKNAHFCSYDCYHSHQKKLAYHPKICPQCGIKFLVDRKTRYNKYCAVKCSLLGRRKYEHRDKICPVCKKMFAFNSKNPFQTFCSQQCNVKSKTHEVDEKFFDKINSESKSYFLGLLFSDGYVSNNGHRVNLTLNDRGILESLKQLLKTNRPLYIYKKCHILIINNEKIHQRLIKLGIPPKKSWQELSLPAIPTKLMQHFLRGVYDGDGSFYISKIAHGKHIYLCSSLTCSSHQFLEQIKQFLEKKLKITFNKIRFDTKGNGIGSYQLRLSRKDDIKKFSDYLYKNSNYYLKRKCSFVKNFYHE